MADTRIELMTLKAFQLASDCSHEYVTLEHIICVLFEDQDIISLSRSLGVDAEQVVMHSYAYIRDGLDTIKGISGKAPRKTLALERVFTRTFTHTMFSGRKTPIPTDLLLHLLKEKNSYAVEICAQYGMTRELLIEFLSPEDGSDVSDESPVKSVRATDEKLLNKYTINLNEQAEINALDPLIGREQEVEMLVQTLARRKKNNAILVGDAGVGKTAIAEGLAHRIVNADVPDTIQGHTVYSLDIGSLLAGTKYRGDFEERMKDVLDVLEKRDDAIFFIDEIHMIMGAGSTGNGAMDVANLLKPALQKGKLRCVGSTTYEEYREKFEKDRALSRRFFKIDVPEPTPAEAKTIVMQSIGRYEAFHDLTITPEAVSMAVDLSVQYLHDRKLPDKAFDVIDSAFARQRTTPKLQRKSIIGEEEIRFEISKIARLPIDTVVNVKKTKDRPVVDIEAQVKRRVFGQDSAVMTLADAIYISKAGLKAKDRPIGSYLLTGPTGTGKTEVSKSIAEILGMKLVRFDMSEYQERHTIAKLIGSPPGYVGYGDCGQGNGALINELEKHPNCVLLMDEVEKAHPDVLNVLLQVMDNGMVTSSDGKTASARNAIVILTSNLGAADSERNVIGFSGGKHTESQDKAVKKFFSPEFRNRLDAVVNFDKLDREHINMITDKFLTELKIMVEDRGYSFAWTPKVTEWLSDRGYDELMGARPMARMINEHIKKPLARKMLFADADGMGYKKITVGVNSKKELTFKYSLV